MSSAYVNKCDKLNNDTNKLNNNNNKLNNYVCKCQVIGIYCYSMSKTQSNCFIDHLQYIKYKKTLERKIQTNITQFK